MIINREKKYIFIHIPRTSGTNLYSCLSGNKYDEKAYGHIFARRIRVLFPKEFDSFYKFAIVRNDYERLHSWWFNRRFLRNSTELDFKKWLLSTNDSKSIHTQWAYKGWKMPAQQTSQLSWITDDNGDIIVDKVIHYENLKKELRQLKKVIHEDFKDMPRYGLNNPKKLKRKNYRDAYDAEMMAFMFKYHYDSLKHFGYDF